MHYALCAFPLKYTEYEFFIIHWVNVIDHPPQFLEASPVPTYLECSRAHLICLKCMNFKYVILTFSFAKVVVPLHCFHPIPF